MCAPSKKGGQRASRLRHDPLRSQCLRKIELAGAKSRLQQSQIQYIALRVAAAEAVGGAANAPDQAYGLIILLIAECLDGARGCVPDLARKSGIIVLTLHRRTL